MRSKPTDQAERGRRLGLPGDCNGAFLVIGPRGDRLKIIASNGDGWEETLPGEKWDHVSVSAYNRCPTWEEMVFVKQQFFDPNECVIEYHPPEGNYVNNHPHVLHMWRPHTTPIPMPPLECV